mmetsp:Transcript_34698/g.55994  ORF Transcript_34698/g.55994 Transcript_34698/m.55994 type:complete len:90 (-) Transcript_34698:1441-1710(-)
MFGTPPSASAAAGTGKGNAQPVAVGATGACAGVCAGASSGNGTAIDSTGTRACDAGPVLGVRDSAEIEGAVSTEIIGDSLTEKQGVSST